MFRIICVVLLWMQLLAGTHATGKPMQYPTANDTIYIFDYFSLYQHGPVYFGSTTIVLPNGEEVKLTTRPDQRWPLDFEQYSMLRIIMPAGTSITLPVRLEARYRKHIYITKQDVTLQATVRKPTLYFGIVLVDRCRFSNNRYCPAVIRNSGNMSGSLFRDVRDRGLEKGVAYTYDVKTGTLEKNEFFEHEKKHLPRRLLKRFPL